MYYFRFSASLSQHELVLVDSISYTQEEKEKERNTVLILPEKEVHDLLVF